jgi:polyphosphate kinase
VKNTLKFIQNPQFFGSASFHARRGRPARIIARMNALVEGDIIQAL